MNTEGRNTIKAASSGILNISQPKLNIVGSLANVNTPSLDINRIGKDPCTSSRENSLKNLGHGGLPALQEGENYFLAVQADDLDNEQNNGTETLSIDDPLTSIECSKIKHNTHHQ